MKVEKIIDEITGALLGIEVEEEISYERKTVRKFSPLDVAYTLAQGYRTALVDASVLINYRFPTSCIAFELHDTLEDILLAMDKIKVDFYFSAGGVFIFKEDKKVDASRACEEFITYLYAKSIVMAPQYSAMAIIADTIIVQDGSMGAKVLYIYKD